MIQICVVWPKGGDSETNVLPLCLENVDQIITNLEKFKKNWKNEGAEQIVYQYRVFGKLLEKTESERVLRNLLLRILGEKS